MTTIELTEGDCAVVLRNDHAEAYFPKGDDEKSGLHAFFLSAIVWAISENPNAFDGLMSAFEEHMNNLLEAEKAN